MDSRAETLKHIRNVQALMTKAASALVTRAMEHDNSKLESPEVEIFDQYTGLLAGTTYGTDAYRELLEKIRPALDHHYGTHRHHPEHFQFGIADMNLIDLLEMICDWMAAAKRHNDGDVRRSIDINQVRFGYPDALKQVFLNTVRDLETL
jgi:hypothetical protein